MSPRGSLPAFVALCAALAPVLAACGGSGGGSAVTAACGKHAVVDEAAATSTLEDSSLRHYATTFYSPASTIYEIEFVLGDDARSAGGKVFPPSRVAFRVKSVGSADQPFGNAGCSRPLLVRIVYEIPDVAREELATAPHTVAIGPGGDRLLYADYEFTNLQPDKILTRGSSAILPLTSATGPFAVTDAAASRELLAVLAGAPIEVMVDAGPREGTYALDGGSLCDVSWPNGGATPLRLIAAWSGSDGNLFNLNDHDGCLGVGVDANGTAETYTASLNSP